MSKTTMFLLSVWSTILVSLSNVGNAQKWADVSIKVLMEGEVRTPEVILQLNGRKILAESMLVDPTTHGIANFVFMIDSKKTKLDPNLWHPDLRKLPEERPVLYAANYRFDPHVMAIRAGETLTVNNLGSDLNQHYANFHFFNNVAFNVLVPARGTREIATKVEEAGPTLVDSVTFPWMSAYLIVAGHPYVGISDSAGAIKIEKLPAGIELDFKIWHESQEKSIEVVTLNGKQEVWRKGCVKLTLKESANDLGTLVLKHKTFKASELP